MFVDLYFTAQLIIHLIFHYKHFLQFRSNYQYYFQFDCMSQQIIDHFNVLSSYTDQTLGRIRLTSSKKNDCFDQKLHFQNPTDTKAYVR